MSIFSEICFLFLFFFTFWLASGFGLPGLVETMGEGERRRERPHGSKAQATLYYKPGKRKRAEKEERGERREPGSGGHTKKRVGETGFRTGVLFVWLSSDLFITLLPIIVSLFFLFLFLLFLTIVFSTRILLEVKGARDGSIYSCLIMTEPQFFFVVFLFASCQSLHVDDLLSSQ